MAATEFQDRCLKPLGHPSNFMDPKTATTLDVGLARRSANDSGNGQG
jgi:hypothetical protein